MEEGEKVEEGERVREEGVRPIPGNGDLLDGANWQEERARARERERGGFSSRVNARDDIG